jgi:hypothetical protein
VAVRPSAFVVLAERDFQAEVPTETSFERSLNWEFEFLNVHEADSILDGRNYPLLKALHAVLLDWSSRICGWA